MAIGAKQKPLHELTALLGAQPAAYRGASSWGEQQERGSGAVRVRADRRRVGLHPVGVAPLDAAKTAAGHGCQTCKWRGSFKHNSRSWSVCTLAQARIDRRKTIGGLRCHQVRLVDPACALHEDGGVFAPRRKTQEKEANSDDTGTADA